MDLQKLKEQEEMIKKLLKINIETQQQAYKSMFVEKYGIDAGDEVEYNGERGIVMSFDYSQYSHKIGCVMALKIKKDGDVGSREMRMYDFNEIKLIKKANP